MSYIDYLEACLRFVRMIQRFYWGFPPKDHPLFLAHLTADGEPDPVWALNWLGDRLPNFTRRLKPEDQEIVISILKRVTGR